MKKWELQSTGQSFVIGKRFTPSLRTTQYIIGKMDEMGIYKFLVPETTAANCLLSRSILNGVVPLLITRAESRKLHTLAPPDLMKAWLWVLACYAYKWLGWPDPEGTKRVKWTHWKAVRKYDCPFCGQEYKPSPRWKDRNYLLKKYVLWLSKHRKKCTNLLYLVEDIR